MRSHRRRYARAALLLPGLALLVPLAGCGSDVPATPAASAPAPTGGTATPPAAPATAPVVGADDIPVAHTPAGGYGEVMPAPILATCTEPLVAGAPDLRGQWQAVAVAVSGQPAPDHPMLGHNERVEQCGDRLVVTGGGVVHDMRVDGTEAGGVHDVAAKDFTTPLTVVASYEDQVHVLRPVGVPGVEIRRHLDPNDPTRMIWDYVGFTATMQRTGPPS